MKPPLARKNDQITGCDCADLACEKYENSLVNLDKFVKEKSLFFPPLTIKDLHEARRYISTSVTETDIRTFRVYQLTGM